MQIEFDADKDAANLKKHGVSLAFGGQVVADAHRLDLLDIRFDYAEDRIICYGSVESRVRVCVFTIRDEVRCIIIVRKANERETRRYHETPR